MNIGKGCAQPRSKPRSKKIDKLAALREPSETRLAAYQIQLDRQSSQPGQILGVAIKSEIKMEIKQELEQTNTRHKYKGKPLWGKYITSTQMEPHANVSCKRKQNYPTYQI